MSNVFVLEDDPQAMTIVGFLENLGHDVTHAEELYSTIYFLERKPGLAKMDKLLFDLAVPRCETEHKAGELRDAVYVGQYAGLDYITNNYQYWSGFRQAVEAGKVAILTAHDRGMQDDFSRKLAQFPGLCKLTIISKLADNMDEQLINFLDDKQEG